MADLRATVAGLEFDAIVNRKAVEDAHKREVEARNGERDTQLALRQAVEERNMSDHVVFEYADLVKSMEGRSSVSSNHATSASVTPPTISTTPNGSSEPTAASSVTPLRSMLEGRQGLQKLVEEANTETGRLHAQIAKLHNEVDELRSALASQESVESLDRQKLAEVQTDMARYQADDTAAAKLVSRYM